MATTKKRIMLCLTKESNRQLEELVKKYGENYSQVLNRALQTLYLLDHK